MGLDNGLCLKIKNREKFGTLPMWIKYEEWEQKGNYDIKLLYWRKCWNVRDVIFDFLHAKCIKTVDDCSEDMPMPLDVCVELCQKLLTYYAQEWWEEHDESILLYAMRVLGYLTDKDPDSYEIYFYDSY